MIKKTSSHIHIKKKSPQKIVPHGNVNAMCPKNKKKGKKRAENHTLKQLVKEREKKTKSKIKSQDYETFF